MKTYSVYFTEPVTRHYKGDKFNQKTKQWEHDVDCEETKDTFTHPHYKNHQIHLYRLLNYP